MLGRRSLDPELIQPVPDLPRLCRQLKARSEAAMGEQGPPAGPVPPREEPPRRLLREFFVPTEYDRGVGSVGPLVGAHQYEIKASTINMLPSFHGLASEDPYRHLDEFLDVCATVKIHNVEDSALRLRLFPFSLKEKARDWLKSLPPSVSIATWEDLQREFLKKYFPISKTNHYRRAISTFAALEGESFHQAWERMKDLLRKCPHHQFPRWQVLQGFYDGLTEAHKQVIDSSCGGSLMMKSEDDAWVLYDTLSENSLHNTGPTILRHQAARKGVSEIGSGTQAESKLDSLSRKMDQLLTSRGGAGYGQPVCSLCDSIGHVTDDCPISRIDASSGQVVNAAQGYSRPYDQYSSTYNPGWRNHPNFGWRNTGYQSQNQSVAPPQRQIEYPPRQQIEYPQNNRQIVPASSSTLEDRLMRVCEDIRASNEKAHYMFRQELGSHSQTLARYDQVLGSHSQSLQKLEQQMGQLAEALGQRRVEGSLPSQPLGNPKGKGPVFVVDEASHIDQYDVSALRSGRDYQPQHQEQPPQLEQPSTSQTRGAASAPDTYASSCSS
ncbi:unnamed protein product [Victoria cruziana]